MPVAPRPTRVFYPYYWQILKLFRNGWQMIPAFRVGAPLGKAVMWDGTRLIHPPDRAGLVETIIEVWMQGSYTREEWPVPFYTPADGDVVLDVGANVGLFSVYLARRNPRLRVIALEPFRENFDCLQANLRSARATSVEAHRIAIGGRDGVGTMVARGERSLDHTLDLDHAAGADTVPVLPLAGVLDLAKSDRISLLKVDVEGSEHDAFAHADQATLRRCERIAIEYHDNIRPGTLALLKERLEPTHNLTICADDGFGMVYGHRRAS